MVRSISGAQPKYRIGLQSYFSSEILGLSVHDPERRKHDPPFDLPLTRETLEHDYYQPFRASLGEVAERRRVSYDGQTFIIRPEPSFDFAFGLSTDRALVSEESVEQTLNADSEFEEGRFVGPDGVVVLLGKSWSVESMRKQPENRRS